MAEKTNQNPVENTTARQVKNSGGALPIVGVIIAIAVIVIIAIVFNSKQLISAAPSSSKYVILFKNIELSESAAIIESLKTQGIKDYRLEDGGTTILVPRKYKDAASIKIAGEGIMPNGGSVGYEIFDKGGQLGATDFDKQVKLSRAISGELSRNIRRIYGIEDARVQVVIPQKELFAEKKNPVQAAVFVKVAPDMLLTPAQIEGIVSLVASSVEDLQKENVTVVDYNGRVLSSEEYTAEYDRLFALLQRKKLENNKTASTKDFQKLLLGDTKTTVGADGSGKDGYDVASMYKKLKSEKKNKGLQFKTSTASKKLGGQEATLQQKMQFKKEYESQLERNVRSIAYQFFPKEAVAAKVNVELNNLETIGSDPVSMIARVTTVLLLDENNKEVKLNPEIREALFKSLSSAVGYINGRDRIDLRWAPMLNFKERSGNETDKVGFAISNTLSGMKGIRLPAINYMFVFYLVGFFVLLKIVSMLRKPKVVVPETDISKNSIFEQKNAEAGNFNDLKDPTIEQVKKAVEKSPEKIAGIIEQWFQEDQNGQ